MDFPTGFNVCTADSKVNDCAWLSLRILIQSSDQFVGPLCEGEDFFHLFFVRFSHIVYYHRSKYRSFVYQ